MKENRTLEFKSEVSHSFLKTVSVYANFNSGAIQFGVNDDGTICGITDPDQACFDIENRINDSTHLKPDYTLSINRGTNVITLSVLEGKYKPYLYRGKAYRRSDTATLETDNSKLERLILEGSNLNFEELSVEDQNLSFAYLAKKLVETLKIPALTKEKPFNVAAALAASGEGTAPIPFSDCALMIPTQLGMIASITVIFGFDLNKSIIPALLSSTIRSGEATVLGKTVVTNILKFIPGVGTVAGGAISAGTAGIISAAPGEAYIGIMELVFKDDMSIDV